MVYEDYHDIQNISALPSELSNVLSKLIENPNYLINIASKWLEYYTRYHSLEALGIYYKKVINFQ